MFKKFYFIVNPAAGAGKKLSFLPEIQSFCQGHNLDFEIVLTKQPKQAIELACKAAKKYEVIIAAGGDGTVNEVVSGLIGSQAVLGILPIGSGNDFAKQVGYKRNLKKDLKILLESRTKLVDIGQVNDQYFFINGLGVGFDGEVATRVRSFMRYSKGFLAYLLAVLRTLATYKFHRVKITLDNDQVIEKEILLLATCNGTTYGGGFNVAPSAKIDDGVFTICLIDKLGRFYALRNIPKIMKGAHLKLPEVHMYTSKHVIIKSEDDLYAQVDGEILPLNKKFEVKILPGQIKVITS